jgi:hypothetical protein
VIGSDTGLPLRRAQIVLRSLGGPGGQGRMTLTDADGQFSFANLPAGRYQLQMSKARYVPTSLGARRSGESGRPFDLAEGQKLEAATVTLQLAGVLTGRVVDDLGDPMAGVTVMAMKYRTMDNGRELMPTSRPVQTDDTGSFRIFGLSPGSYVLAARAEESNRFGAEMADDNITGFAPTYYPNTPVAEDAQSIVVNAGAEVIADVALVAARLATVSGVVTDARGAPATGGFIMSRAGGGRFFMGGSGGQIKGDGTFVVSGLAPGEYILQAHPTFGMVDTFDDGNRRQRSASVSIVVAGEPVSGVRLVVREPIRIPVVATFEDAGTRPERVFISASSNVLEGGMAKQTEDGRMFLEVVPGTYRVSANAGAPWYAKRVTYRNREVEMGDEIELAAEAGGRLEVVFSSRSGLVEGGVTDATGKVITDYTVVILPEAPAKSMRMGFQMRIARGDQQGRFKTERLQPGSYVAVAVAELDMETAREPDVLEALRRLGKPFKIADTETVALALTLDKSPLVP